MEFYVGALKIFGKILKQIKREIAYVREIKRREKEDKERRLEYITQLGEKVPYWEDLRGLPHYEVDFKGSFEDFAIRLYRNKYGVCAWTQYKGTDIYYLSYSKNKKLLEFYDGVESKLNDEKKRKEEAERSKREELKKEGKQRLEELLS